MWNADDNKQKIFLHLKVLNSDVSTVNSFKEELVPGFFYNLIIFLVDLHLNYDKQAFWIQ